jgi:hypothetical protein
VLSGIIGTKFAVLFNFKGSEALILLHFLTQRLQGRDAVPRFFIAMYSTRNFCVAIPFFRPSAFNAVYSHLEIRGEIVGFAVR